MTHHCIKVKIMYSNSIACVRNSNCKHHDKKLHRLTQYSYVYYSLCACINTYRPYLFDNCHVY